MGKTSTAPQYNYWPFQVGSTALHPEAAQLKGVGMTGGLFRCVKLETFSMDKNKLHTLAPGHMCEHSSF